MQGPDMTKDEKYALMKYLIFQRGKLQGLSIKLDQMGENADPVDGKEQELGKRIKKLRRSLMRDWQADSDDLMAELRGLNDRAQRRVRELEDSQDRVAKVGEILGFIDRGLGAISGLLA
jgi:hypothetical protein